MSSLSIIHLCEEVINVVLVFLLPELVVAKLAGLGLNMEVVLRVLRTVSSDVGDKLVRSIVSLAVYDFRASAALATTALVHKLIKHVLDSLLMVVVESVH